MPRFPPPSGGHQQPPITPAPTVTSSSEQSSPTSISPTASPSPPPPSPTTTPTAVPSTPPHTPTPSPPPLPPSPIAPPPPSVGAPSPDPAEGGQTQTNGGSPPVSPDSNASLQPMQPMQSASQISPFSQSTWIVVNSATPTTMIFSGMTTIGGSPVDTTWTVTTSFGGETSTMSGSIPIITGSTRSDNANSSRGSVHSSNHLGAIIGSVAGTIIMVCLILFAYKVHHHRRAVLKQERQMTENWISRSFTRAIRHGYRDVDMPAEVPAAHARSDSYLDMLVEKDGDSFTMRSLSPTPSSAIMSSFGDSNRRRPASELSDAQNGRSRPTTIYGDQTAPLLGPSIPHLQDPFLDPLDTDPMVLRVLSSIAGIENDAEPSRSSTVTDDKIIFNRPVSRSSSTLEHHQPTGHYDPDPFSDSVSPHSPSPSAVMDGNSSSVGSTAPILSTASSPTSPIGVHVSGKGLIRGPNLMALIDEVHRD